MLRTCGRLRGGRDRGHAACTQAGGHAGRCAQAAARARAATAPENASRGVGSGEGGAAGVCLRVLAVLRAPLEPFFVTALVTAATDDRPKELLSKRGGTLASYNVQANATQARPDSVYGSLVGLITPRGLGQPSDLTCLQRL